MLGDFCLVCFWRSKPTWILKIQTWRLKIQTWTLKIQTYMNSEDPDLHEHWRSRPTWILKIQTWILKIQTWILKIQTYMNTEDPDLHEHWRSRPTWTLKIQTWILIQVHVQWCIILITTDSNIAHSQKLTQYNPVYHFFICWSAILESRL